MKIHCTLCFATANNCSNTRRNISCFQLMIQVDTVILLFGLMREFWKKQLEWKNWRFLSALQKFCYGHLSWWSGWVFVSIQRHVTSLTRRFKHTCRFNPTTMHLNHGSRKSTGVDDRFCCFASRLVSKDYQTWHWCHQVRKVTGSSLSS